MAADSVATEEKMDQSVKEPVKEDTKVEEHQPDKPDKPGQPGQPDQSEQPEQQPGQEPRSEPKPKPEPESEPKPKPEAAEPKPKPEPGAEPKSEPKPQPQAEPEKAEKAPDPGADGQKASVENGKDHSKPEVAPGPAPVPEAPISGSGSGAAPAGPAGPATASANGSETGAAVPHEVEDEDAEYGTNEIYKKLRDQGVKARVAIALLELYDSTEMTPDDMDERAVDMLKSFPVDHAVFVIGEVKKSNLLGVQNHAQFMMSVMRNFRDKVRQMGAATALNESLVNGPSYESIKAILDRTGYPLEVTNGQRKYGGPPPGWEGPATGPTGAGHEIYIGKIPNDIYEDTLIPLFEEVGKMWDLRLMMDPLTGKNRGYAFVTYCDKNSATEAAKKFDGYEIEAGKSLKVNVSVANTRLFIGNIPKSKSKEEIIAEFKQHAEGVTDCIIYSSPDAGENRRNRGFCFLDFCDHKSASDAKRRIHAGKIRAWNLDLVVDWAEQQEEPDEETMAKVKVLYVRNLKEAVTESQLKEMFSAHGEVDHVKKIKDYAFVHFNERDPAVKAMEALNGTVLEGIAIEISLAKPQSDKKKVVRGRPRVFGSQRTVGDYGAGPGAGVGAGPGGFGSRSPAAAPMMRGAGRGAFGAAALRSGGYGGAAAAPMDYGGYGGYDPYGSELVAAGYDELYGYGAPGGGYGGGYGGGGYDGYGGAGGYGAAPDPYAYGYGGGGGASMRSGGGRSSGRGLGSGGFAPRGTAGRGRSISRNNSGGSSSSSSRGTKRTADPTGGPSSKRDFGGNDA